MSLQISMSLLALVFSLQVFANGSSIRGGGDTCESQIKIIRDDIRSWIQIGGYLGLSLPQNLSPDTYKTQMLDQIAKAKIKCVGPGDLGYPVLINQTAKTCRFDKDQTTSQITCDYIKFFAISESDRYNLVHHELAGLAEIENPNEEDSNYQISNQLSGYLSDQVVKKLVVNPQGTRMIWENVHVFEVEEDESDLDRLTPTSDRHFLIRGMRETVPDTIDCGNRLEILNLNTQQVKQISLKTRPVLENNQMIACSYDPQTRDLYYFAEEYDLWDSSDHPDGHARPTPPAQITARKVNLETFQDTLVHEFPNSQNYPVLIESIGNRLIVGLKKNAANYNTGEIFLQVFSKTDWKKEFQSSNGFFSKMTFFPAGKSRIQYQSKLWFVIDKKLWLDPEPVCHSFVLTLSQQVSLDTLNVACDESSSSSRRYGLKWSGQFMVDNNVPNTRDIVRAYDLNHSFQSTDYPWHLTLTVWNQTLFGYAKYDDDNRLSSLNLATGQIKSYPELNIPSWAPETYIERTFMDQFAIGSTFHENFSGTPRACELFLYSLDTGSLKHSFFYPEYFEKNCSLNVPVHFSFYPNKDEEENPFVLLPASSATLQIVDISNLTSFLLSPQIPQAGSLEEGYSMIKSSSGDWYLIYRLDNGSHDEKETTVILRLKKN